MASYPNDQGDPAGAIPVYVVTGTSGGGYTPTAADIVVVTTGGTAITALTGPANGALILNPPTANGQAVPSVEPMYVSVVGTPGSTEAAGNGSTVPVLPGGTFIVPPIASGVTVKVNAPTSGHKFTAFRW